MSKLYQLSFVQFQDSTNHMQGTNFGNMLDAEKKGAVIFFDDQRQLVWIQYKGKISSLPFVACKGMDFVQTPQDVSEAFGAVALAKVQAPTEIEAPKRGRGRPPTTPEPVAVSQTTHYEPVPMPTFDPNDLEAAAAHRAKVRAASANSNRPNQVVVQNDYLIQEARNQAMGLKHPTTSKAQVQNAQQVGAGTAIAGKPKAISHAQMQAQVKAEEKSTL